MGDMRHESGQIIAGASKGVRHEDAALLFHPLADELIGIAVRLREAAEVRARSEHGDGATTAPRPGRPAGSRLALARKAYALRRKRASIFGTPDIFGEPAWDILLDLYIAAGERKSVSVSSACIGSAAPATTGLRWLSVLAAEGLVVRENDAEDHRRVLVRLTPSGAAAMDRFFDCVD
jgi:hypothetical protein